MLWLRGIKTAIRTMTIIKMATTTAAMIPPITSLRRRFFLCRTTACERGEEREREKGWVINISQCNVITYNAKALRPVHNMTLNNALRCVIFMSTLVEMQHDARIDSDPILAFLYVAFLCLVIKKSPTFEIINLYVSRINATQGLVSLCEPAFTLYICVQHNFLLLFVQCLCWTLDSMCLCG